MNDTVSTLTARNVDFAQHSFVPGASMMPALQTMATLRMIAQAEGAAPGPGWNLIVLQHTDCGITRLGGHPELLAATFGIDEAIISFARLGRCGETEAR